MANLSGVSNHFSVAKEGFVTTTSSPVTSGATTVQLTSVAGYTNGDTVVLVIDANDVNKKQVFTGTVDTGGSQITNVVWTEGANTSHILGAPVIDYVTASHQSMTTKGLLVSHDQDGTLKAGAVDNAAVLASNVVETAKIKDGAVTAGKLGLVMVSAYKSGSSQSLSAGTWTLVTLNSENFDVGGNFASNKFTAPTTGYYLVSITCVIGAYGIASTAYASAAIYKNGSIFQKTMTIQGTGNANTVPRLSTTALMSLTAGDYIELYAVCSEAGRYVDVGNETSLIVVQVG